MHKEHLNKIYAILNTLKLRFLPNTITDSNLLPPNIFSKVETTDESYGWFFSFFLFFFGGGNQRTRRKPPTCRKSLTNLITLCCIECTLPWAVFEFSTVVVMGTDCKGTIIDHCLSLGVVVYCCRGFFTSLFWLLCVV